MTPALYSIEAGMKLRLQQNAPNETIPDAVCGGCQKVLMRMISKGAALRAEQVAKEQHRLILWKSRVSLVKQAKLLQMQKSFAEAAIAYEKYLRVLEVVYEANAGELTPELFKNEARSPEITVIASVYWDLMRIYDTNPRQAERQRKAGEKLALFLRYSPIFPQVTRKAESLSRTAKNPEAFKHFLKISRANRPRCFIATAAFDGVRTETVEQLCQFRDQTLRSSAVGRYFIFCYYKISPGLAHFLDQHPSLKPYIRSLLARLASATKKDLE
jgi:hypothetical protein